MTAGPHHIRLALAREPGHPDGDPGDGYDIVAFLDDAGRLDAHACRAEADRCRVRRFVRGATVATGRLRHTTGDRWIFAFGDENDVSGYRLGDETFTLGEYVSVVAGDGSTHTYSVERMVEL